MKSFKKNIVLFLALFIVANTFAQTPEIVKYKSLFTFNFVRYIGWPPAAKHGDFVIGVLKNPALADQLKKITTAKKFGYQNIIVTEFKKPEEVTNCQILFVSSSANFNKHCQILSQKLLSKNSLIITESAGAIKKGSMINFVIRDNQLKFEISERNAKSFGLDFSNSLLTMANAIIM